jgi:hypothetical protein
MGLSIVLETEFGEALERVDDPTDILHHLLPSCDDNSYCVLRFIDWYGNTVFNRQQVQIFLEEWEKIKVRARDERDVELLARVAKLAEKCLSEPHQYLKFIGD